MIFINGNIRIGEDEIKEEFIHASGPGGQNVNKVATAVQIRFNVADSPSLTEEIRRNLFSIARKKINKNGVLIITANRYRIQSKNRQDALERLTKLIYKAIKKPKIRHISKPTLASKRQRLESKNHRSKIKQMRRPIVTDSEE